MYADVDGDTRREELFGDTTVGSLDSIFVAGTPNDEVTIGTKDAAKVVRVANFDNDPADDEVIVLDPTLEANGSGGFDLAGDADDDADVVVAGTKDGATITVADADGDGDVDIHFEDPTLSAALGYAFDQDGDGDYDVTGSGTRI
jgi:hypothetical protein